MNHEITLEQAADSARQAEVIAILMKNTPVSLGDYEQQALAELLCSLIGRANTWLIEEQAQRENKA